jgi:hypothetical protein
MTRTVLAFQSREKLAETKQIVANGSRLLTFVTAESRTARERYNRYGRFMLAQRRLAAPMQPPPHRTVPASPVAPVARPPRHPRWFFSSVVRTNVPAHPVWNCTRVALRGADRFFTVLRPTFCAYYVLVSLVCVPLLVLRGLRVGAACLSLVGAVFAFLLRETIRIYFKPRAVPDDDV